MGSIGRVTRITRLRVCLMQNVRDEYPIHDQGCSAARC